MRTSLQREQPAGGRRQICAALVLLAALLFTCSACSGAASALSGGGWQSSGLVRQHIRALAVDSDQPQNVFAGDAGGQVFASADGGQHWSERGTGLPVATSINALAFDASDTKLYAAAAGGLFVSADAARHWQRVGVSVAGMAATRDYVALAFDLETPHSIYSASGEDVFISHDAGHSWSALALPALAPAGSSINGLTFDSDKHQLWAATTAGVYLYRFAGAGAGWQALNNGLPADENVYAIQPASLSGGAAALVFAGTHTGFYRSVDGGAHWSHGQQSLARVDVRALLVDFRTPSTVYAATPVGILRSVDSGETWGGTGPGLPRSATTYALLLGASDYAQLFAAMGDVYLFPGTHNALNPLQLLPVLFFALIIYLLYRFTRRGRTRRSRRTSTAVNRP